MGKHCKSLSHGKTNLGYVRQNEAGCYMLKTHGTLGLDRSAFPKHLRISPGLQQAQGNQPKADHGYTHSYGRTSAGPLFEPFLTSNPTMTRPTMRFKEARHVFARITPVAPLFCTETTKVTQKKGHLIDIGGSGKPSGKSYFYLQLPEGAGIADL